MNQMNLTAQISKYEDEILTIPAVQLILSKLEKDLAPDLLYHSKLHALDVLHEVILFSILDNVPPKSIILLGVAAVFHDAGFLVQRSANEIFGAQMFAGAVAGDSRFSQQEIETGYQMILDTALVRQLESGITSPTIPLSTYLLDADVSNFGRDDFSEKMELYYSELKVDRQEYLEQTLGYLLAHTWHTKAARSLREEKKQENLEQFKTLIALSRFSPE